MKTDEEILEVGRNLVNGESQRCKEGISSVTNPTVAVVKVWFDKYTDAYMHRNTLQKRYQASLEKMNEIREKADDIILKIWNEVEEHFGDQSDETKRQKAMEYGLTYVFRKNEIDKKSSAGHDQDETVPPIFHMHQKN